MPKEKTLTRRIKQATKFRSATFNTLYNFFLEDWRNKGINWNPDETDFVSWLIDKGVVKDG